MQRYRQLAASLGLWLSLGGFQEKGPDPDHLYNCHVVIDDQGSIVASYRKVGGGRHELRPCEDGLPAGNPLPLDESRSGPRGMCRQLAAALSSRPPCKAFSLLRPLQIHLFNVDVPGGPVLMESRCMVAHLHTFCCCTCCWPAWPLLAAASALLVCGPRLPAAVTDSVCMTCNPIAVIT